MKPPLHFLFSAGLIALALLLDGCATAPQTVPLDGYAYYTDDGYFWCWENGNGWEYLGRAGEYRIAHNGAPIRHHREPPPGAKCPPPPPGQDHRTVTPSSPAHYYYIASNHEVSASANGISYQVIGYFNSEGIYTEWATFAALGGGAKSGETARLGGHLHYGLVSASGGLGHRSILGGSPFGYHSAAIMSGSGRGYYRGSSRGYSSGFGGGRSGGGGGSFGHSQGAGGGGRSGGGGGGGGSRGGGGGGSHR